MFVGWYVGRVLRVSIVGDNGGIRREVFVRAQRQWCTELRLKTKEKVGGCLFLSPTSLPPSLYFSAFLCSFVSVSLSLSLLPPSEWVAELELMLKTKEKMGFLGVLWGVFLGSPVWLIMVG